MSKKVLALVLALVMVIAMLPTVAFAADFADTKGHWAEAQIDRWTDAGVVGGDGTGFNPNGNMTRAEAAKTFASLLKLTKKAPLTAYTDVPTETWKVDALAMAVEKGIINGMSATTLVPDGTLTREQMFVMIGRALGVQPVQTATKTFADGAQTSPWAEGYINALANMGVIHGIGENKLNPTGDINRASVMTALDNLIGGYANEDGQTVEIVEGKITLIVADDVKVTGTADPDVPIVVAGEAKTVDLEGVTVTGDEAPVVQVQVSDVKVENAPTGTSVTASEGATGVTANGAAVEAGGEAVEAPAPETETQTGTQTPAPAPVPSTPSTTEPTTKTVTRIVFDATHGGIELAPAKSWDKTCYGGENTCYGGENTCYGGENNTTGYVNWLSINVKEDVKNPDAVTLKALGISLDKEKGTFTVKAPNSKHATESAFANYEFAGWCIKKATVNGEGKTVEDYVTTLTEDTVLNEYVNGNGLVVISAMWQAKGSVDNTCYGGENDVNGTYGAGTGVDPNVPGPSSR